MKERNGKGALRVQKEKNGEITKDEEILFSKEALFFFREEIEKNGFSPTFASKHWNTPGVRGSISRGYGRTFGPGGVLNPDRVVRINQAAETAMRPEVLAMGDQFALASGKALAKSEVAKSLIPKVKSNPRIADIGTWYEANVPSHLFGDKYQALTENLGPLKTIFGL